ncbi:MAG: PEP-CTERM sorting domain-containing protein [Candidatus Acidiferrales bacterium]
MMKQVTRAGIFLLLFMSLAAIARADDAPATLNDFKVVLNDPSCPSGTICADIGYEGPSEYVSILNPVIFVATSPVLIPAGQTAACSSDFLSNCAVIFPGNGEGNPTDPFDYFYAVAYWGGTISQQEDLDVGVSGLSSLALDLPANFECDDNACPNGVVTLTPEPPTVLLFVSGLLLLGFFRRRGFAFAAASRAQFEKM